MKRLAISLIACMISLGIYAQVQNEYDPVAAADTEAKRLTELLKLEYWQTFYVDSTLQHDLTAMYEETKKLQKENVTSYEAYLDVQDKWVDKIEESYQKFFTDEQWNKYLKTGAEKARRQRDKRRAEKK
ncbi:MAG: hypothetical protein HUJ95_03840 [Bacteroidales bacterium]|nr:hypothetical protein [Bacteroidales bacterium]